MTLLNVINCLTFAMKKKWVFASLLFLTARQPQWARVSSLFRFRDHTQTHHTW